MTIKLCPHCERGLRGVHIKSLVHQRVVSGIDINDVVQDEEDIAEFREGKRYYLDGEWRWWDRQVICPHCGGLGYVDDGDAQRKWRNGYATGQIIGWCDGFATGRAELPDALKQAGIDTSGSLLLHYQPGSSLPYWCEVHVPADCGRHCAPRRWTSKDGWADVLRQVVEGLSELDCPPVCGCEER